MWYRNNKKKNMKKEIKRKKNQYLHPSSCMHIVLIQRISFRNAKANWRESQNENIAMNKMLNVYNKNQWVRCWGSVAQLSQFQILILVHWIYCLFNFIHSQFKVFVSILQILFIYLLSLSSLFLLWWRAHTPVGWHVKNIKRVDSSAWMRYFSSEMNNS